MRKQLEEYVAEIQAESDFQGHTLFNYDAQPSIWSLHSKKGHKITEEYTEKCEEKLPEIL
jgi:hypothetical protein